ncbi:MAG: TlpA family protein disulfide reductase, partial [Myxococcaceae bacterium]
MRRLAAILVLALACAGEKTAPVATQTQALTGPAGGNGTSVSSIALDTYPQAGKHAFSADQGQVVVIDAWATWCAPCLRSLPQLQALQK